MTTRYGQATRIFLDLFQCRTGAPDLQRLDCVSRHFARLPWENLTKLLRKHDPASPGRRRSSEEVLRDHADLGSGGTCFSLSNALRRIAADLGYDVAPVMADMRHGPNVHCALLVRLGDRRLLLDPGYLVAEPVPLERERPTRVAAPGQELEYRPRDGGDRYELWTTDGRGESRLRYRLRARAVGDEEFRAHWQASFDSTGMRGLHLNRLDGEARLSAHDLNLRIDDGRQKHNLKLREGYVETVAERFGLDPRLVRRAFATWTQARCRTTT